MIDDNARSRALEIRGLPPSMLDAGLLADYVATGAAFDLAELCRKSGISLKQVTHIVVARGLDAIDRLPGYAVTADIFELAEHIYAIGSTRQQWQQVRTRHKPGYLEGRVSRQDLKRLHTDQTASQRHYARIFFWAWAVFWDDDFLNRMMARLDGSIIASLPVELLTEEVCFNAVARSGMSLRYVPDSLRSLPVCIRAVQNEPAAIAFTPARFRDQIRQLQHIDFG